MVHPVFDRYLRLPLTVPAMESVYGTFNEILVEVASVRGTTGWKRQVVNGSAFVAVLGLVFVASGVTLWVTELAPTAETLHHALYELVMHVLFGGIILVLGAYIERSSLPPEDRFSVLIWFYGGFTLMFCLSVWGHIASIRQGLLTVAFVSDFVVYTSLGGAFGVVAGMNRGQASKNRRLADRNRDQRETLALLTRLVSHDVRNDIAIVKGYAELLEESVDEDDAYVVDVIQSRMDNTTTLLEDAGTLVKTLDEDREFAPVNLSRVLRDEVASLEESNPTVDVETDIPAGIRVKADSLLKQVFSNLLGNAVAHNDAADLTISVRAEQDTGWVTVEVADDGVGIPPEDRERCLELGEQGLESDGDGIGLYLVSRLTSLYGGDVAVDESASGGAKFTVRLPTTSER